MKTTIQSPATAGNDTTVSETKSLSKSQVENAAIALAVVGVIMCLSAESGSLLRLAMGVAVIWCAALIAVRNNRKEKKGGVSL